MLRNKAVRRAIDELAPTLFAGAARTASVGLGGRGELQVDTIDEFVGSDPSAFSAVVWRPHSDLRAGLARLRAHLPPSARLLVVAPLAPLWWSSTRELLGAQAAPRLSRDLICEHLLMGGWLWPRVWVDTASLVCVSGELPDRADPLDAFFTQPLSA